MQRREFLASSMTTLGILGADVMSEPAVALGDATTTRRQYYEVRLVHFENAQTQERYETFLRDALLPALNRAGVTPVGVFTVKGQADSHSVYLLLPYASIEALAGLSKRLDADEAYRSAGASVLDLPSSDPPYTRVESSLLLAFEGMPTLAVPAETAAKKGRSFELRTYESHSEKASKKKIEMFNVGEIGVFRRNGFQPVFYGEALIGPNLPNLTYMVTYPEGVERKDLWARFGADPEGKRLFAIPAYQDKQIVSKIISVFLEPTPYSQV